MRRVFDPIVLLKRPIHPLALAVIFSANALLLFSSAREPIIQSMFAANVGCGLYALYYYFHVVRPTAKLMRGIDIAPTLPASAFIVPPSKPRRSGPKPPPNR